MIFKRESFGLAVSLVFLFQPFPALGNPGLERAVRVALDELPLKEVSRPLTSESLLRASPSSKLPSLREASVFMRGLSRAGSNLFEGLPVSELHESAFPNEFPQFEKRPLKTQSEESLPLTPEWEASLEENGDFQPFEGETGSVFEGTEILKRAYIEHYDENGNLLYIECVDGTLTEDEIRERFHVHPSFDRVVGAQRKASNDQPLANGSAFASGNAEGALSLNPDLPMQWKTEEEQYDYYTFHGSGGSNGSDLSSFQSSRSGQRGYAGPSVHLKVTQTEHELIIVRKVGNSGGEKTFRYPIYGRKIDVQSWGGKGGNGVRGRRGRDGSDGDDGRRGWRPGDDGDDGENGRRGGDGEKGGDAGSGGDGGAITLEYEDPEVLVHFRLGSHGGQPGEPGPGGLGGQGGRGGRGGAAHPDRHRTWGRGDHGRRGRDGREGDRGRYGYGGSPGESGELLLVHVDSRGRVLDTHLFEERYRPEITSIRKIRRRNPVEGILEVELSLSNIGRIEQPEGLAIYANGEFAAQLAIPIPPTRDGQDPIRVRITIPVSSKEPVSFRLVYRGVSTPPRQGP